MKASKMNKLLNKLTGGDLRSDGKGNEVAEEVIKKPDLLKDLLEGLESSDKIIRMRTAHALEVISRTHPKMIEEIKPRLMDSAYKDKLPEVKWHLAQIFGNISLSKKETEEILTILFGYLEGKSILVKAWSIVTLGILGKWNEGISNKIIEKIKPLQNESTAVRHRVMQTLKVLGNRND